jgi:tetrapyrrole methylase family protein/MazG family protein
MLDNVPRQMPALSYSQEIQDRVARVGFDWADIDGIIDKLAEEVGEFKGAGSPEKKSGEFGDLLFTLANIARRMGIDLEAALRQSNQRFYRRFSSMEALCRQRGLDFSRLTFDEQNALWEEVKKSEK